MSGQFWVLSRLSGSGLGAGAEAEGKKEVNLLNVFRVISSECAPAHLSSEGLPKEEHIIKFSNVPRQRFHDFELRQKLLGDNSKDSVYRDGQDHSSDSANGGGDGND